MMVRITSLPLQLGGQLPGEPEPDGGGNLEPALPGGHVRGHIRGAHAGGDAGEMGRSP